jgi:hypothetical protein
VASWSYATSEDDEAPGTWTVTARKARKYGAGVERKVGSKQFAGRRESGSVGSRIGNDEERVAHPRVVSQFEHHTPLDRLDICETRFDLEPVDAVRAIDDGIPRPSVRPPDQRHLSPETHDRWDTHAQARENPHLAGIADRIGIRIEAQARHEPDSGAQTAELLKSDVAQRAALEPIDLARRHPGCTCNLATTQAGGESAHTELAARGLGQGSRGFDGSIEATIAYGHAASLGMPAYLTLTRRCYASAP